MHNFRLIYYDNDVSMILASWANKDFYPTQIISITLFKNVCFGAKLYKDFDTSVCGIKRSDDFQESTKV